jgi:hypothetical protein
VEQCRETVIPAERVEIHQYESTTALTGPSPICREMAGSQVAEIASQ